VCTSFEDELLRILYIVDRMLTERADKLPKKQLGSTVVVELQLFMSHAQKCWTEQVL